jgi:hypothetical protein
MPSGNRLRFLQSKLFDKDEVARLERKWGITLPQCYVQFLLQVGAGGFFLNPSKRGSGLDFRRVDDSCEVLAAMETSSTERMYSKYLPLGSDLDGGTILVLDIREPERARIHSVRSLPDKWSALTLDVSEGEDFEDWFVRLVVDRGIEPVSDHGAGGI